MSDETGGRGGSGPGAARDSRTRGMAKRDTGQAEEGVRHIGQMMASGQWETGASHAAVAATFGVSVRTVEGWAIQASRVIRALQGDGEELRARLGALLELHEREARNAKERKNAIMAIKVMAEVMLPKRVEVKGSELVANFTSLQPRDRSKKLRELAAKLLAEADRIDGLVVDVPRDDALTLSG